MEKKKDVLVGVCGCGEFVKIGSSDVFDSGEWVSTWFISPILIDQLDVAKQVSESVPMSRCNKCVEATMSGALQQYISRTSRGVEVLTTYPKRAASSKE